MTNFKMTDAFTFPKTKAEKVEANMQAIRLVKKLKKLERQHLLKNKLSSLAMLVGVD